MDPQFKRLLNSALWAQDEPINRANIEDPTILPVVDRGQGWEKDDYGPNGNPPDRRRWNQWIRELQGAAHTKREGVPQYDNLIDYQVGAISAVRTSLYLCILANGPATRAQHPQAIGQTAWRPMTGSILPPDKPRDAVFDNEVHGQLLVQWKYGRDNGDAISRFELQYKRNDVSAWSPSTPVNLRYPYYVLTGLTSGDTYNVRIRAVNGVGTSDWLTTSADTRDGVPIPDPGNRVTGTVPSGGLALNLSATPGNANTRINWIEPYNGGFQITEYEAQWKRVQDNWSETNLRIIPYPTREYLVTGLTNQQRYQFRVAATNRIGTGTYSNVAEATPIGPTIPTLQPILLAPTLSPVPISGFTATPNWRAPANAITAAISGYLWQATYLDDDDWSSATTSSSRVWRQDGHFSSGTKIKARFRLNTSLGLTGWSPQATLTIGGAFPDPPGRVSLIVNHNPAQNTYLGSVLVQLGAGHNNNGSPVTQYSMRVVFTETATRQTNSTGVFEDSSDIWSNNRGTAATVFGACRNRFGWSFSRQGNTVYIPF